MKVLVCGGRGYADEEYMFKVLDEWHKKASFSHVIHGAARGADTLAGQWARERGVQEVVCPANWNQHSRVAGPIRNAKMAELMSDGDIVMVFPGGSGTNNMAVHAATHGLKVLYV